MAAFLKNLFKSKKPAAAPADRSHGTKNTTKAELERSATGEAPIEQVSVETTAEDLIRLATAGKTAAIRLAAAERIQDETSLQSVQKAAKGRDKGVYQLAKHKLQVLRDQQQERQRRQDKLNELLRRASEHAKTGDTQMYAARTETLRTQWQGVSGNASIEQNNAFLAALDTCLDRMRAQEAEQVREDETADKAHERRATLAMLEATLNELRDSVPERGPSLASLDAVQTTQENRWLEATRETTVERQEQKEYQELMQQLRQYIAAVQRFETDREWLAQAEASPGPDHTALRERLATIGWPGEFSQPALLATLQTRAGNINQARKEKAADQNEKQKQLDALLDRLEQSLEDNQFRESRRLHKEAQQIFNSLDQKSSGPRQARLTLLGRQLHDLQDWRGFATRPKQEELCADMEYLAAQHMEPEAKATHIKELQQLWRDLGGSSDQTLWQRFKLASDEAYAPCESYFAAKSDLKTGNLNKRRAICEQLAGFIEAAQWNSVDWRSVERIHRVARQEWREAKPVDFKANRPLQRAFDRLLKELEAPLNEERQRNEQKKQAIVERAQGLIDHEPLSEATQQAKTLQKEWESVGVTRRQEDKALWQAFRAACDAIFARRDAQKAANRAEDDQLIEELEALTRQAETLRQDPAASNDDIRSLSDQLRQAPRPGRLPANLHQTLEGEKQALVALLNRREQQQKVAHWQTLIEQHGAGEQMPAAPDLPSAREIVVRIEIVTGMPSPDADQALRMSHQVDRLASGFGNAGTEHSSEDSLDDLVGLWCQQQIPETEAAPLTDRLRQALTKWQEQGQGTSG